MKRFKWVGTALHRIEYSLLPPAVLGDETIVRLARPLALLAAIGFVLGLIYTLLWPMIMPEQLDQQILAALLTGISLLALMFIRLGKIYLARDMWLITGWVVITATIVTAGGARAPIFGMYTLVVVLAALLSGWPLAVLFAGISLAVTLVFVMLDLEGAIMVPFATPFSAWFTQAATMLMVTCVAYAVVRQAHQALEKNQESLVKLEKARQELLASEERYRLISAVTSDFTFSTRISAAGDLEHTLLSGAVEAITGYSPEIFLERGGWLAVLHPDDVPVYDQGLASLYQNQRTVVELRIINRDGETRWVGVHADPVWDTQHDRLDGINGGVRDVTERKHMEAALRASEQRFKAMVANSSDIISVLQADGTISFQSESATRVLGYDLDQFIGSSAYSFVHPDDVERVTTKLVEKAHNLGSDAAIEYRFRHAEGFWLYLESRATNLLDDPAVAGIVVNTRDITERKLAEELVRESEQRYRALTANLPASAVILFDEDLRFVLIDGPEVARAGYNPAKMVGKTLHHALPADFAALVEPNMRAVLRGQHFTAELPFEDQIYLYDYVPLEYEDGVVRYGMIVAQNITERRRLEAELQEYTTQLEKLVAERTNALKRAKDELELVLNSTANALAFADPNGDLLVTNPAFQAIFAGHDGEQSLELVLWSLANEDQVALLSDALLRTIYDSEEQRVEAQIIIDGGPARDLDFTLIPISLANDDKRKGVLLSGHDITQLREIERFKEQFVADAVHDLATPITGLSTRLYLLKRTPEKLFEHIQALENQVQHLRNLLDDLRTLSQMDRGRLELDLVPNDVNVLVQRVIDTYEPVAINKEQTLTLATTSDLPLVRLDRRQMERVLVNIVSNAINYTASNKAISIRTGLVDDGRMVEIVVADEGMGIRAEDQKMVFERFYRTAEARRSVSSGTGLGLAISKEIIEMHGGAIIVTSTPGVGSTFAIRLPLS